jgi:hypothetical protein
VFVISLRERLDSLASWFDKVRFKLRGAKNWPWADATVFEYTLGELRNRSNLRSAELSYSFWIEGHIYSGIAVWDESDPNSNLYLKNDMIQIQYNSSDPNESYFPEREQPTTTFFLTLIGAAALIATLIWLGSNLIHHS